MINIFNNPKHYLKVLESVKLNDELIKEKKEEYSGKTILCAWLTKLCPAKCSKCFFKSNMYKDSSPREQYELSDEGVSNLIKFVNESNNSYLMLSGGGEPMIRPKQVNKIIREAKTDRIVIVTSGIWANNYLLAEKHIKDLYESYKSRGDNLKLILRLSIDEFHLSSPSIKEEAYHNIINIFRKQYRAEDDFELRIHTMQNDPTLESVINNIGDNKIIYEKGSGTTDNNEVIKIVPKKAIIEFKDGYSIYVGLSKLFIPNIKVDINEMNNDIKNALDVFEKDMKVSEYSNPSIITNCNGLQGLDFWSDYNGNITAWGCQNTNNLHSLYTDSYEDLTNRVFNDISTYAFLDKGYYYRRNIIKDINPKAVLRSEAINLRDYSGAFLMEEDPTKLYFTIRVIKDYLTDSIISKKELEYLPKSIKDIIDISIEELNNMYTNKEYDIISQYFDNINKYTKEDIEDLFILIRNGHYDINKDNLTKLINYYNNTYNEKITDIKEIIDRDDDAQLARLHNRISPMQDKAKELCLNKEKNN